MSQDKLISAKKRTYRKRLFSIPSNLILLVTKENSFRNLQVFLVLKSWSNVSLQLTAAKKKVLCKRLSITLRTLQRVLKWLIERNWIGYSKSNDLYFVRGFDRIRYIEGISCKTSVRYDIYQVKHIDKLKAFCIAVCYSIVFRYKQKKEWRVFLLRLKTVGHSQGKIYPPISSDKAMHPISNTYISRFVGRSIFFIKKYKKLATALNYLDVKLRSSPVLDSGENQITIHQKNFFFDGTDSSYQQRYFFKGGLLYKRETNLVRVNLNYLTRKPWNKCA